MNRLVVNPNRPDTWEIQLKDGENQLGRSEANDFTVADASVSSSHCQVIVSDGDVSILDLGSTNGTFINGESTREAKLQNGQTVRLGSIEMIFYADVPQAAAPDTRLVSAAAPRLRLSGVNHEPESATPPVAEEVPPPLIPQFDTSAASPVCKSHPKSHARWFCGKCKHSFCDLCINSHHNKRTCRKCGVECAPLEIETTVAAEKGFLASLPGAFIYPFRGNGVLILIFSAILFAALGATMAGILSILIKMAAIGYLFSYMQNIIHATAAEEKHMPELPGRDDLFGGFVRLVGTVIMSFGLTIGLLVAKLCGVDIPVSAIIITMLLGCVYFPMAFLVVAMKDNVLACNPLVVVPAILRVPFPYLVTVVLFASLFGFQQVGNLISSMAGAVTFTTTDMSVLFISLGIRVLWSFVSIYLLTVNMRILGLLYVTQKEKLAWY